MNHAQHYKRLAKAFADCSLILAEKISDLVTLEDLGNTVTRIMPTMWNASHAIELYLKSFLLSKDKTEADLLKYGHDLLKALKACENFGLNLSDNGKSVIAVLGKHKQMETLRYSALVPIAGRTLSFPSYHRLAALFGEFETVFSQHTK